MAKNFLIRDDCLKRLRMLCDGDPWKTAFALGSACQLLELESLNEVVEMVEEWSGNMDGEVRLPDRGL
jgi:hypothetical protein